MEIKVRIPTPLRSLTAGEGEVYVSGAANVREVIESLESKYPGIKERLCDETGEVRRFVNIFLNDEDIRFLKGLDTPINDASEISIIPAIAGGSLQ